MSTMTLDQLVAFLKEKNYKVTGKLIFDLIDGKIEKFDFSPRISGPSLEELRHNCRTNEEVLVEIEKEGKKTHEEKVRFSVELGEKLQQV